VIDQRSFTYRGRIKVSLEDLAMALQGKKTCTIRRGTARVEGDSIDLTDGSEKLRVQILSVETMPYSSLNDQHAQWEGFASLEELREDLAKYYRSIIPDQPMTVIRFRRAGIEH
jgi:hypothetical protein